MNKEFIQFAILTLGLTISSHAIACREPQPQSAENILAQSKVVFLGFPVKAEMQNLEGLPVDLSKNEPAVIKTYWHILEIYKGNISGKPVTVHSIFCGMPMSVGETYIVSVIEPLFGDADQRIKLDVIMNNVAGILSPESTYKSTENYQRLDDLKLVLQNRR